MDQSTDILILIVQREQLVRQLAEKSASIRELAQTLTISRSTVNRALNDLKAAQVVQKNGADYELTLYGRFVYQKYNRISNGYDTLGDALPLLNHLPKPTAVPDTIFDSASVMRPTAPSPDALQSQLAACIRQSEEVIGTAPIVSQRFVELFHDQLTTHDLRLSLLLSEQVVKHLWNTHHDGLSTAMETDHCTLWSAEQTPPFSLIIIDSTDLWLGVYDECGHLQGLLQSESPAAIEWAKQHLHHHIDQSTPICLQELIAEDSKQPQSS